jgi:hypothetical protein
MAASLNFAILDLLATQDSLHSERFRVVSTVPVPYRSPNQSSGADLSVFRYQEEAQAIRSNQIPQPVLRIKAAGISFDPFFLLSFISSVSSGLILSAVAM